MSAIHVNVAAPLRGRGFTRAFLYAVIILGAWNAVLRPSVELPVTPYYLLAPGLVVWLLLNDRRFRRWTGWFGLICVYGITVGTIYGVPLPMQLAQLLKYLQLLAFFGVLSWLYRHDRNAPTTLSRIIVWLAMMALVIAGFQALTGAEFPTVVNEESGLWLNTFFFTPNDLALFLGGLAAMLLSSNQRWLVKVAGITLFSLLNLRNDAKAVLLATVLMIGMAALFALCARCRVKPIVGVAIFLALVPLGLIAIADRQFEAGDTAFNFLELLLDPVERILNLEPYDLGGSIFDRTDALIYSIQALQSMSWLGLGPGGSVHLLSLPNFELLTAKSLHNAIAELIVELGPVTLGIVAWLLRPVVLSLFRRDLSSREYGRLLLVAAAPMLSVSQSSGYISNYAFWLVAYVVWCGRPFGSQHSARRKRRAVRQLPPVGLATA